MTKKSAHDYINDNWLYDNVSGGGITNEQNEKYKYASLKRCHYNGDFDTARKKAK